MTASRLFSVATVAALASFAAHADTYGAYFQADVQSTRDRAEVRAEGARAVPDFKNYTVLSQDRAPAAVASREAVRAEAVTAARAGAIATGNRG